MVKERLEVTLEPETIKYLEGKGPRGKSKAVEEALSLLQKPTAKQLMEIVAVAGLAQNFAAMRSLVTTGIQKGHMKMHLMNILNQLEASISEKEKAVDYFKENNVSHSAVVSFVENLRS